MLYTRFVATEEMFLFRLLPQIDIDFSQCRFPLTIENKAGFYVRVSQCKNASKVTFRNIEKLSDKDLSHAIYSLGTLEHPFELNFPDAQSIIHLMKMPKAMKMLNELQYLTKLNLNLSTIPNDDPAFATMLQAYPRIETLINPPSKQIVHLHKRERNHNFKNRNWISRDDILHKMIERQQAHRKQWLTAKQRKWRNLDGDHEMTATSQKTTNISKKP